MALFEMLIGGPVTKAGNHRCRLSDRGGVSGGHGCIPSGPRSSCVGLQDPRCRAWLVHAWIVVSLVAGRVPGGSPGDLAGRETGSVLDEGRRQGCSTHSCRIAGIASSYTYAPGCTARNGSSDHLFNIVINIGARRTPIISG
jgi:hypothetical protein